MNAKAHIWKFLSSLVTAGKLLQQNDPLRLAGATAFFTTFGLPPILMVLIQSLSLLFNKQSISNQLFGKVGRMVGQESEKQLLGILDGFRALASSWPLAIGRFIFLIFVGTTLFKVIQSSINQLWMVQKDPEKKFRRAMVTRLKSALVILFTGLLFMVSIAAESLKVMFGHYVNELFPGMSMIFTGTLTSLSSLLIICTWFTILFRYLPDGKPKWPIAIAGGLLTGLLFNAGIWLLKYLLIGSKAGEVYGASASIILLLLFVFYASLIFYYGAAFTKVWGDVQHMPIEPVHHASRLYQQEAGD